MAANILIPLVSTALKVGSKLKNFASKKITAGEAITAVTTGAVAGKGGKKIEEKIKAASKNKKYGETDLLNGSDHP